jgi:hypothetical protein
VAAFLLATDSGQMPMRAAELERVVEPVPEGVAAVQH